MDNDEESKRRQSSEDLVIKPCWELAHMYGIRSKYAYGRAARDSESCNIYEGVFFKRAKPAFSIN